MTIRPISGGRPCSSRRELHDKQRQPTPWGVGETAARQTHAQEQWRGRTGIGWCSAPHVSQTLASMATTLTGGRGGLVACMCLREQLFEQNRL